MTGLNGRARRRRDSVVAPPAAAARVADLLLRFEGALPKLIVFDLVRVPEIPDVYELVYACSTAKAGFPSAAPPRLSPLASSSSPPSRRFHPPRLSPAAPPLPYFLLDYTLWPFWCECYSPSHSPRLYPDVPAILDGLEQAGVEMALASRTPTPHVAHAFIDKLNLRSRFRSIQLIPAADGFDHSTAQKDTAHLPNIRQETGHCYADMLFFDDESGNVNKVSRLGVVSRLVDTATGVSLASLEQGLQAFANSKASGSMNKA